MRRWYILTRVIGFLGGNHYDFISYVGHVLSEMNFQVLLVDYTPLQELMATVPEYVFQKVTEYRDLFYIGAPEITEIKQYIEEETYDFILIDFEYSSKGREFFLCHSICFVTDMQRHHLEIVENLKLPSKIERFLVVKEESPIRKMSFYLRRMITEMKLQESNYFSCPWGERERKNQMRCQYQYDIPWERTSSSMKRIVWSLVRRWLEYQEREEIGILHLPTGGMI